MSEAKIKLETALARLHEQGGTDNRLIASRGPAWFVLCAGRGEGQARCIAATQKHLGDALTIAAKGVVALRQADFSKARGERALSRQVNIATDEERSALAGLLQGWFETVFEQGDAVATHLSLKLGDGIVTDNEPLHQAIRVLARRRTHDARQAVYRALLRSQLQLVVDDRGDPAPFGTLGGAHTYAVFTSTTEADLWDPRGPQTRVLQGREIFPMISALRPGSLQINPQGRLGGELYRNEVEALARACERPWRH